MIKEVVEICDGVNTLVDLSNAVVQDREGDLVGTELDASLQKHWVCRSENVRAERIAEHEYP